MASSAVALGELDRRGHVRRDLRYGMIVAVWHFPLVTAGNLAPVGIAISFVITLVYVWLFNRTGSALMTLVFHVAQGTVSYAALGFTGADADRMDWLVGALWLMIAVALVTLDRKAWQTAPSSPAPRPSAQPAHV